MTCFFFPGAVSPGAISTVSAETPRRRSPHHLGPALDCVALSMEVSKWSRPPVSTVVVVVVVVVVVETDQQRVQFYLSGRV